MHRIAGLAAIAAFALAGCEPAEEPVAPAAEEESLSPAETAMMAPDGLPYYGVFELTSADGETRIMRNVKEDGTLVDVVSEGDPVPGTWTTDAEGNFCVTMQGETDATCYTNAMTDGTWTATSTADPAQSWTVERVMGSEVLPTEAAG